MSVSEKAKTSEGIWTAVEQLRFHREHCFDKDEKKQTKLLTKYLKKKWVRLEDLRQEIDRVEKYGKQVVEYECSRIRGEQKQKIQQFPKLPKNPNTADRINHLIECLDWLEQFEELLRE